VLPILHLNGYKISNPTILARITHEELDQLLRGYGWTPYYVEGDDPMDMHRKMAVAMDNAVTDIQRMQHYARTKSDPTRPHWPMIVLNSPKGWTGPKKVDGLPVEGTFRAHQIPLSISADTPPSHLAELERWMRSYKPEELFDERGRLLPEIAAIAPKGSHRMGANSHANGGILRRDLIMPDFRKYAVPVSHPGSTEMGNMEASGKFIRDIIKFNDEQCNFRLFGPDEALSNRLGAVFETTNRQWNAKIEKNDEFLSPEGHVFDSMLSEHQCEGWLEGYLLTGRHGLFHSYEAFIRIIDSMLTQHAKWLKISQELPWRKSISSLNYLLTSHVWEQDHNGFTHQDPGFIDHVINKEPEIVRVYLPPDSNCLLATIDHCLRSKNYVNVIVAGKHKSLLFLDIDDAAAHCEKGIDVWQWASNDDGKEPEVVLAAAGDIPTLEMLAAVSILREYLPDLKIRFINIVDLMRLKQPTESPHGLSDEDYDLLFTKDKHVIIAYHGYPWLIHLLTYRRKNRNIHVRGYKEEGTITTPFDMTVLNDMDRFHLVMDVIDRLPQLGEKGQQVKNLMQMKLAEHRHYIELHGIDMPEVRNWKWKKKFGESGTP
jgi:xylulose-5-phosphate/fructose-6-phosphate phosphoketolase